MIVIDIGMKRKFFDKNVDRIFVGNGKMKEEKRMVLKSIVLHNFRCFCDLEVNFNNRLTVVVGNNGAGKSAVLEAAAIAAGTMTFAMDGLTNYGIKKSDAHCYN